MVFIRKFKISDVQFQGFQVNLDMDNIDTLEDICNGVKNALVTHLQENQFEILVSRARNIKFHIHDHQFGDILIKDEDVFWVCSHD
jgi:ribosomal protein S15P/S13E